jgi:hypothetical protein
MLVALGVTTFFSGTIAVQLNCMIKLSAGALAVHVDPLLVIAKGVGSCIGCREAWV